jgi:AraC-like DNA-binding protein
MLQKLIAIATRHGSSSGIPTEYPRLTIRAAIGPTAPIPALFEPKFYLLLQGAKRMTIAGCTFDCSAETCAVASVGLPFVSEVVEASPTEPYLSVELKLDAGIVASLLLDMREQNSTEWQSGAISLARADVGLVGPLGRLLSLLDAPSEIPVLAAQFERELYYRLLAGPLGARLRQIGANNSRFSQIKLAAEWIGQNANNPMSVEWLASHVGMSVTSFHRHFKAVTASSPLAYQRQLRLLEARRQLASGEANVTEIAYASGYVSASQFSREYKKAFGIPPSHDAALLRR